MFWTGINPHKLPVTDVLSFNEHLEDMIEEQKELIKAGVGEAIAEALSNM
jgi:hypothetical protein